MRAKTGYKKQKTNPEHWNERRHAYTSIGRYLHRYFLTRTVRRNRFPTEEEGTQACDGTCPLCWPEAWVWNASANRYEPRVVSTNSDNLESQRT